MTEEDLIKIVVAMIKSPPPDDEGYVILAKTIIAVVKQWTILQEMKNEPSK